MFHYPGVKWFSLLCHLPRVLAVKQGWCCRGGRVVWNLLTPFVKMGVMNLMLWGARSLCAPRPQRTAHIFWHGSRRMGWAQGFLPKLIAVVGRRRVRARAVASEGSAFWTGGPGDIKDVKEFENIQAAVLNRQLSSSNRSLLSHHSWLGNIWLRKRNNSWKQTAISFFTASQGTHQLVGFFPSFLRFLWIFKAL